MPAEDRGLFRELRARRAGASNGKAPSQGGGNTQVAQSSIIRDALEGDPNLDRDLSKQTVNQGRRELSPLNKQREILETEIKKLRQNGGRSNFEKIGEALRKFAESRDDHLDFYEDFEMNRVPPVPRREGAPPEMEVPDIKTDPKILREATQADIEKLQKSLDAVQKRIDYLNSELNRLGAM